jgi:hypothetical protein
VNRFRNPLRVAVLVAVCVAALSGCVRYGGDVEGSARTALDAAGLVAGAEAFDTSGGLGDSWNVLVCVEVPESADDRELAEYIAKALNAVKPTVDKFAGHVEGVSVRLIDSVGTADLDNWCRGDDGRLLDLEAASELLPPAVSAAQDEVEVEAPYDQVVLP